MFLVPCVTSVKHCYHPLFQDWRQTRRRNNRQPFISHEKDINDENKMTLKSRVAYKNMASGGVNKRSTSCRWSRVKRFAEKQRRDAFEQEARRWTFQTKKKNLILLTLFYCTVGMHSYWFYVFTDRHNLNLRGVFFILFLRMHQIPQARSCSTRPKNLRTREHCPQRGKSKVALLLQAPRVTTIIQTNKITRDKASQISKTRHRLVMVSLLSWKVRGRICF